MKIIITAIIQISIWFTFCAAWEFGLHNPAVNFAWIMLYGHIAGKTVEIFGNEIMRKQP